MVSGTCYVVARPLKATWTPSWGLLDMRDLGAVLDHEEPLPHPVEDREHWLLPARGPAIFSCPSEPRTHGR